MSGDVSPSGDREALTGVNWLTPVNRVARCARKVERTRAVGFRLPEPLHTAYTELPSSGKTVVKVALASLIYALAKKYDIEVECEEQLKPMLSDVPLGGGQIIINATIAEAKAEAKAEVNLRELEEVRRLLEDLFNLVSVDGRARRVLEQRVRKAQQLLDRIALN